MRNVSFIIFFLFISITLNAQDSTKIYQPVTNKKSNKWFFEGSVSLSLGTQKHFGITPLIGYKISPFVHVGATLSYYHFWDNTFGDNPTESNIFGGSLLARWVPVKEFFLQIEPAMYSYKVFSDITTYENKAVPFIFLGAGFNYYVNPKMFLVFQAKFDVLKDKHSPYKDQWHPFFNAGVGFAL